MEKNLCEINFINKEYLENLEGNKLSDGEYIAETKN